MRQIHLARFGDLTWRRNGSRIIRYSTRLDRWISGWCEYCMQPGIDINRNTAFPCVLSLELRASEIAWAYGSRDAVWFYLRLFCIATELIVMDYIFIRILQIFILHLENVEMDNVLWTSLHVEGLKEAWGVRKASMILNSREEIILGRYQGYHCLSLLLVIDNILQNFFKM